MTQTRTTRRLTDKQEFFAQEVASGLSNSAAYRTAYHTEKMLPQSVHRAAHELSRNPRVAARIGLLRGAGTLKIIKTTGCTREELIDQLDEIQRQATKSGKSLAAIRALRMKCRLLGFLKPARRGRTALAAGDGWS